MKRVLALDALGGIAAASVQRFTPSGWWLNSGQGVAPTSLVLALLAVPLGAIEASRLTRRWLVRSVALWAGANLGLAIVLFTVGPGTLFPIALVFGAGISAIAVGAGSLLGQLARAVWARAG